MDEISVRLEEYRALREELVLQIGFRYTILSIFYGVMFTLIVAVVGLGRLQLLAVVPALVFVSEMFQAKLCFFILHLGSYIRDGIQHNINDAFGKRVMYWEGYWGQVRQEEYQSGIRRHTFLYADFFAATLLWWSCGSVGLALLTFESNPWWATGFLPLVMGYLPVVKWHREINLVRGRGSFKSLTA